jgi:hypothetical protein
MTLETSHGKRRLTRPRLRDVAAESADRARSGNRDARGFFLPGNTVGRNSAAKAVLTSSLHAALRAEMVRAAPDGAPPSAGAEMAAEALTLYRSGRRDLQSDSPIALSHLVRWAANTALATRLAVLAADAGLGTDRGARLLELAHACEGRAERASVAAMTMARSIGKLAPSTDPHAGLSVFGDPEEGGDEP